MPDKEGMLSKELMVATAIYRISKLDGDVVYYSKLVKHLEGKLSTATIKKSLDILFDLGMVFAEWKKHPDTGRWVRALTIAGESSEFIERIYREVYGSTQPVADIDPV